MPRGTLEVVLIGAKDLHDSDLFSKYCILHSILFSCYHFLFSIIFSFFNIVELILAFTSQKIEFSTVQNYA